MKIRAGTRNNKFKIHGRGGNKRDDSFLNQTNTTVDLNMSRDNGRGVSPMRANVKQRNSSQDPQDHRRKEENKKILDHGSLVNYANRESSVEVKSKKKYNGTTALGGMHGMGQGDLTRDKKVNNRPLNVVLGNNVAHHIQNKGNRKKNH